MPWLGVLTPQILEQVAVYVPAALTAKVEPVAPVLQVTIPVQPVADKFTFSVPQILVLFAETLGATGNAVFLITKALLFPLSPQLLLHVAVYVPATLTEIVLVVAPVFHLTVPLQPEAVNVADSVPQSSTLLALIIGDTGAAPVVITIWFDAALSPQPTPTHLAV